LSAAREAQLLCALLFCSYAYFYQSGNWNQNSRLDLTRAIVERGTLRIDDFHENTGDKTIVGGHWYSNKAPGQSLAAVPAHALLRPLVRSVGIAPDSARGVEAIGYWLTLVTASLPTVLAAWCLFHVALALGASVGGARFATLAFGLGTPAWAYATLFWGHPLAAGCMMAAFAAALALRRGVGPPRLLALVVGLGGGWATVTEYPAAAAAAAIAALALSGDRARMRQIAAWVAASGGACAAVLLGYQRLAFGHALETPMKSYFALVGYAAWGPPRWSSLVEILFSSYRGLLPLAPLLALAPFGFVLAGVRREARAPSLVALGVVASFVLMNICFTTPHGGWTYGPRYIGPALPFLCLPLALLWSEASRVLRGALALLLAYGVALSLIAVATMPMPPNDFRRPVEELLWPAFRDGDLALNHQGLLETLGMPGLLRTHQIPRKAWNLGMLVGLSGHASLVPLYLLWALGGVALWRQGRSTAPSASAMRV
jgi:hypothetical protein